LQFLGDRPQLRRELIPVRLVGVSIVPDRGLEWHEPIIGQRPQPLLASVVRKPMTRRQECAPRRFKVAADLILRVQPDLADLATLRPGDNTRIVRQASATAARLVASITAT
jgi:hypothetical protein